MSASPLMPSAEPATRPAAFTWDVPAEWKSLPASGMRTASFSFTAADQTIADISVIVLGGDAGGLTANINRWRGQIGLHDLSEAEVKAAAEIVNAPAGRIQFCFFTNPETKTGIAGGVLSGTDAQWFFKMMGPEATVTEAKASFVKFLQSVRKNS